MADILSPEERHLCMSHIRATDTRPEILVRKFLHSRGFRFRIHVDRLPGKPDIVLRKYHTVIFVNGCFWHGHEDCGLFRMPKTNTEFWQAKIECNRNRDRKNSELLHMMGWHVIRIWECQLKPKEKGRTLDGLVYALARLYLSIHR